MAKKVLIRSDSSSNIGLGHIKRDLVYASRLRNTEISFAVQDLDGNINNTIPFPLHVLKTSTCDELIELCRDLKIDHLIIDNYAISYEDEKKIKESCALFLSVFDDTYEKHYCDEVINHNIGSQAIRYKGLLQTTTQVSLIEPLVRDEFIKTKLRDRLRDKNKEFNIFICMGGVDNTNLTPSIIEVCQQFNNTQLHIVTTSHNKNLPQLKDKVKSIHNIKLHIDTNEMARLMNQSDLAIITPSVIVHEVMFMKLPFIVIKSASNQNDIYSYLKEKGFNALKEFNEKELYNILLKELS